MATSTSSSTRGQFNTKSPTIRRIRELSTLLPGIAPHLHKPRLTRCSPRSLRARHVPFPRLPCRAARNQPLRMALHAPWAALHALLIRALPRTHHPPADLPPPAAVLPLPNALRPLRNQPRDLPEH